jgi:hypothetical protein
MRNYLLFLIVLAFSQSYGQDAGIYQTYAILDNGTTNYYHGGINNGGTTPFSGHSFGNVTQLTLKGGEIKSWKNNGGDVTGAKLYYRVYVTTPEPDPLPSFVELDLPWADNGVDGNGDNQKWAKTDSTTDILAGLAASETYTLELYWKITTNVGDKVDNASGVNFKADFTVDSSLSVGHFNQKDTISIVSDEIHFFKNGAFEISIFNLAGKRIKQIENTFSKNHMLPLNLEKGVYIVQVREGQYLNNYKTLVQ